MQSREGERRRKRENTEKASHRSFSTGSGGIACAKEAGLLLGPDKVVMFGESREKKAAPKSKK